ncbi:hypothetical protein [Brevibacillus choshinensis]|uniref:hypothetical protein n=2 Tax=Brevibacillus choshinensis TaxID=54911 RepID=UPI002E22A989|nr:hypothetical protein [Brevibacillus choshinensis]
MINLLLGFHIMVVTFSLTDKPTVGPFIYQNNQVIKQERIAVEELEQYPDVKQFIVERGAEQFLKTGKEIDEELFKRYVLNQQLPEKIYKDGMTADIEMEIAKRYGLEAPSKQEVRSIEQTIVAERSVPDHTITNVRIITSIATFSESSSTDILLLKDSSVEREHDGAARK